MLKYLEVKEHDFYDKLSNGSLKKMCVNVARMSKQVWPNISN